MAEKTLTKYMVLLFISTLIGGNAFAQEKTPNIPTAQIQQAGNSHIQQKPASDENTPEDDSDTQNGNTSAQTATGSTQSLAPDTPAENSVVMTIVDNPDAINSITAPTNSASDLLSGGLTSQIDTVITDSGFISASLDGRSFAEHQQSDEIISAVQNQEQANNPVQKNNISSIAEADKNKLPVNNATSEKNNKNPQQPTVEKATSNTTASTKPATNTPTNTPNVIFHSSDLSLLEGKTLNSPVLLPGSPGKYINSLGTDRLRIHSDDKVNKTLGDFNYNDKLFLDNNAIDPNRVQTLQVNDDTGKSVGSFQFVKQSESLYLNFMPEVPRAQEDNTVERFAGLYSYIGTPTASHDFSSLNGSASYSGKVIGYAFPVSVGDKISSSIDYKDWQTPQPATADINLLVNFSSRDLTGKITNRFDHLTSLSSKFTDDNEKITPRGLALDKQPLYISAKIKQDHDSQTWGFQGALNGSEGVYADAAYKQNVAGINGVFMGAGAKEIVGIINAKQQMSFGATKTSATPPASPPAPVANIDTPVEPTPAPLQNKPKEEVTSSVETIPPAIPKDNPTVTTPVADNPMSDMSVASFDQPVDESTDKSTISKMTTKPNLLFHHDNGKMKGGFNLNSPVVLSDPNSEKYLKATGSDQLRANASDTENKTLADFYYDDSVLLDNSNIDPEKVQTLNVTDDSGKLVGTFKFIKQSESVYLSFIPQIPALQKDDKIDRFGGLYSYIGKPTTSDDFENLEGTSATYTGKVIGYAFPLKAGDKPDDFINAKDWQTPLAAVADITLNVDDYGYGGEVTGTITHRFDHLTALSKANLDYLNSDADIETVVEKGLIADKQPLYIKASITQDRDSKVWGFRGEQGVYSDTTHRKSVGGIGGVFMGEGAKDIVGIINAKDSKETLAFGASKDPAK